MTAYDAVVIGGGHNGLITAAYLGRAGLRTLVLERRDVLGGAAVTEEPWPGFKISTAAYLCGLLMPRIIQDLDLERHGYRILPKDPAFFSPFPDGRYLLMGPDAALNHREISKFSVKDAEAYPKYEKMLERVASVVEPTIIQTPPTILRRRPLTGRR